MKQEITPEEELRLAAAVAEGDESAEVRLYTLYRAYVFGICCRILRASDIAEDLTQETFIHIFNKIGGYSGSARLSTWIYRIAVNCCLMHLRREKNKLKGESLTATESYLAPRYEMKIDERILLERAIAELPPGYRKTFILREIIGLEHEECAAELGISVGTVKSQAFKAREKMQRLIKRRANPKIRVCGV